jgi:thiamine biosynthesis lipoprotein
LVDDGALVTSTVRFRRWHHHGTWRHHIVDPATGLSSTGELSAVIVADTTASRAEALAKAALVAGRMQGTELLVGAGVTGWLIDHAGHAVTVEHAQRDEVRV